MQHCQYDVIILMALWHIDCTPSFFLYCQRFSSIFILRNQNFLFSLFFYVFTSFLVCALLGNMDIIDGFFHCYGTQQVNDV